MEAASWSASQNIGLLRRQLEDANTMRQQQKEEISRVERENAVLKDEFTSLKKSQESDRDLIARLEEELTVTRQENLTLRDEQEKTMSIFAMFKV